MGLDRRRPPRNEATPGFKAHRDLARASQSPPCKVTITVERSPLVDPLLIVELERPSKDAAILRLSGEIDMASEDELTRAFSRLAEPGLTVVIDASKVTFIDSTGLNAFVRGKRLIHETGSRMLLVPSPQVRRVFHLVFPGPQYAEHVDSLEEALAMLEES